MQLRNFPEMDVGAPSPEIDVMGDKLRCSYICHNPAFPGYDSPIKDGYSGNDEYCAVIEFRGVASYKFGYPNDEGLGEHPLYELGVRPYEFYRLTASPELDLFPGKFLWVVAFHDETLQVVASSLSVVTSRVDTASPREALELVK